ncbi:CD59 glycoprotein-like [Erpetoichthys calabaricus]|uniref:CD59 glycoprotein-like n=1 Tax=Erpetoichthys calabaricus TaxID=27687 RepID=UPI0010A061E0|nr:CD59 glycoprotein-like [Erpetoichthys calabaricus]
MSKKMKATVTAVLIISFATYSVDALLCYVCSDALFAAECYKNIQNCSAEQGTCLASVSTDGGVSLYMKMCSSSFACSVLANANIEYTTTRCCSTDLCNNTCVFKMNFLLLGVSVIFILLTCIV